LLSLLIWFETALNPLNAASSPTMSTKSVGLTTLCFNVGRLASALASNS